VCAALAGSGFEAAQWVLCYLGPETYVTVPLANLSHTPLASRLGPTGVACTALLPLPYLAYNTATMRWFQAVARATQKYRFIKLRYKGKSFRWHRRKGALVLRFGRSHLALAQPATPLR
jgi:hypothetical protein